MKSGLQAVSMDGAVPNAARSGFVSWWLVVCLLFEECRNVLPTCLLKIIVKMVGSSFLCVGFVRAQSSLLKQV